MAGDGISLRACLLRVARCQAGAAAPTAAALAHALAAGAAAAVGLSLLAAAAVHSDAGRRQAWRRAARAQQAVQLSAARAQHDHSMSTA